MAAVGTTVFAKDATDVYEQVKSASFTWLSDGSGNVSGGDTIDICGTVERVVTAPGSVTPSSYKIMLVDADGCDILAAAGATRSTSAVEQITPSAPPLVNGTLELQISGAGGAKTGSGTVYWRHLGTAKPNG